MTGPASSIPRTSLGDPGCASHRKAVASFGIRRRVSVLLCLLLLAGCDATSTGTDAYRDGRYGDALAAFDREVKAAGDAASPELLYDKALAALRVGELDEAECAARQAAARGGPQFAALGDFVRGNGAFARSEAAEAESLRPNAEPKAFERAISHAEDALASWRMAAASRADWPEARRNVERGLLRLERLRERKGIGPRGGSATPGADGGDEPPQDGPPLPPPPSPADEQDGDPVEAPPGEPESADLPPGRVMNLFEVLHEKERQKRALRRAERRARGAEVEKDW